MTMPRPRAAPVPTPAPQNFCSEINDLTGLATCTNGNATIVNGFAEAMKANSEFLFSNSNAARKGAISPAEAINAHVAHGMGITGKGVTVSIIDGGFNVEHPDLKSPDINLYGTQHISEPGHGSNVAGLAIGRRGATTGFGQGIAYDAKALLWAGSGSNVEYATNFAGMAKAGATVSSNSYGFGTTRIKGAMTVATKDKASVLIPEVSNANNKYIVPEISKDDFKKYFVIGQGKEVQHDQFLAFRDANGLTNLETFAALYSPTIFTDDGPDNGTAPTMVAATARWKEIIEGFKTYQDSNGGRGVIVWAPSNADPSGNDQFTDKQLADYKKALDTGAVPAIQLVGMTEADAAGSFPLYFPELAGAWISVVNVMPKDVIASFGPAPKRAEFTKTFKGQQYTLFSAPCGSSGPFCVSMDGGQVMAAGATGSSYIPELGSSQAAPQIAGAVALVQQAFPNLKNTDVVTRLLFTADNSWFDANKTATLTHGLTHNYSEIFGHGFIDLQKALQPVGKTSVTTFANNSFTLSDGSSRIRASEAFGADLAARASDVAFIQSDIMNAGFATTVGDYVIDDTTHFADDMLETWNSDTAVETLTLGDDAVVSFASTTALDARGNEVTKQRWHFSADMGGGLIADAAVGSTLDDALGFRAEGGARGIVATGDGGFDIPFLGLAEEDTYWGAVTNRGKSGDLVFGAFSGSDEDFDSYGLVAQRSWRPMDGVEALATGGLVLERGGMLGTKTSGAFANDESSSVFGRIGARADLGLGFAVKGSYTLAQTQAEADGVFTGFSPIMSDSFALSVEKRGVAMDNDHAALTLSQPVRALSGTAETMLPTGYDAGWNLTYSPGSVDLTPDARELRLTASWAAEVSPGIRLDVGAAMIKDAGHVSRDELDFGGFAGIRFNF